MRSGAMTAVEFFGFACFWTSVMLSMVLIGGLGGCAERPGSSTAEAAIAEGEGEITAPPGTMLDASETLEALLFETPSPERISTYRAIGTSGDRRFIAPLIDIFRFLQTPDEIEAVRTALESLTRLDLKTSSSPWRTLIEWYGAEADVTLPPGYTGWKGRMLAQAIRDPRFEDLLYDGAESTVRVEEVVWGGVRVDGIPALVNPALLEADEADYLTVDEPVFGVNLNGDVRAYPLRIVDWHEMVNDVVGGTPVALAYCTLCGAGVLYETQVDDRTFEFGSSGFLFRSNKLMYDRQTNTLWNQLTGEPVIGELVGDDSIVLPVLPVVLTSWGDWRSQHPETKVLDLETGYTRRYDGGQPYGSYFANPGTMFPVWQRDDRWALKDRIFALRVDGRVKAYPLPKLVEEGGIVHDQLGERSVVLVASAPTERVPLPEVLQKAYGTHHPRSKTVTFADELTREGVDAMIRDQPDLVAWLTPEVLLAMPVDERLPLLREHAYDRRDLRRRATGLIPESLRDEVAQRGLIGEIRAFESGGHTFERPDDSEQGRLVDENGLGWMINESGLVADDGTNLPRLGGHLAYWFGWYAFYPDTEVYGD